MQKQNKRFLGLALSTALTSVALSGCSSASADPVAYSASSAQAAMAKGQNGKAIGFAETAVQGDPRNADFRAMLGSAYLDAGRFESAAQSFAEAMELGDNSARTALGFTLAAIGAGRQPEALDTLRKWDGAMDAGDYGLALALAGRPAQGVHVLGNAIRDGQNTAKIRQNLAYAYALSGDWRSARVMAAEDVPANQLGDRLASWAATSAPEYYRYRVARLLGTPVVTDNGMPAQLALANYPETVQLAAATGTVDQAPAFEEAFAESETQPVAAVAMADDVPATAPTVAHDGDRYVSRPIVQRLPAGASAPAPAARIAYSEPARPVAAKAPTKLAPGDHRVQLGSFLSADAAERAKGVYTRKYPQLDRSSFQIARAEVGGRTYYRVSAGGLARTSAQSLCSSIKAAGNGCLAYAGSTPLPGTIDTGVRVASR